MPEELTDEIPTGRVIACWIMTAVSAVLFLAYGRVMLLLGPAFLLPAPESSGLSTEFWLLGAAIVLGLGGFALAVAGALARHGRAGMWLCVAGLLAQSPGVLTGWVFL